MSEQSWNFGGIEAASSTIQSAVGTTGGLLDEGKVALANLASAWGGSGSEAYQNVQRRWDDTSAELNNALKNLALKVSDAGQSMSSTEAGVTGMFQ